MSFILGFVFGILVLAFIEIGWGLLMRDLRTKVTVQRTPYRYRFTNNAAEDSDVALYGYSRKRCG